MSASHEAAVPPAPIRTANAFDTDRRALANPFERVERARQDSRKKALVAAICMEMTAHSLGRLIYGRRSGMTASGAA